MGRRRYNQDERDEALGALMASAVLKHGEWIPDFRGTARVVGISDMTLRRWWKARDKAGDVALRRMSTRGTEASVAKGASGWLDAFWQDMQQAHLVCMHELKKPCERGIDDKGRGWEVGANPAQRAAAMRTLQETAVTLDAKLRGEGESTAKVGDVLRRLGDALHRAGLE